MANETSQLENILNVLQESGAGKNSVLYQSLTETASEGNLSQGDIIRSLIGVNNTAQTLQALEHTLPDASEEALMAIHEILLDLDMPSDMEITIDITLPENLDSLANTDPNNAISNLVLLPPNELSGSADSTTTVNTDDNFTIYLAQMHQMNIDTYLSLPNNNTVVNNESTLNIDALRNIGAGEDSALFKLVEAINNNGWDEALSAEISDIYNTSKVEGAFRFLELDSMLTTTMKDLLTEANKATLDDIVTPSEVFDFLAKQSRVIAAMSDAGIIADDTIEAIQEAFNGELSDETAHGLAHMHVLTEEEFKNPLKAGKNPKGEFNRKSDEILPDGSTNPDTGEKFENYELEPGEIMVKADPLDNTITNQIASSNIALGLGKTG